MNAPTMLEQLLEAMEQCKAVIRQAHETTRDLKVAIKEALELGRELQRDVFEPYLRQEIPKQWDALAEATRKQWEEMAERNRIAQNRALDRMEKQHLAMEETIAKLTNLYPGAIP